MHMRPYYDGGGFRLHEANPWAHIVFMVMAVIFWGVVIYGLVIFINKYAKHHDSKDQPEDALTIARNRYARGEISQDEYRQLKKDLTEK